jgi:hypothetical protein
VSGVPRVVQGRTALIPSSNPSEEQGYQIYPKPFQAHMTFLHLDFRRLYVPQGHRFARFTWLCWYRIISPGSNLQCDLNIPLSQNKLVLVMYQVLNIKLCKNVLLQ